MKTRIEYNGSCYSVFVNGELVSAHSTYGQAERALFDLIRRFR